MVSNKAVRTMPMTQGTLPEDVEGCHAVIGELVATLNERDRRVEQLMHRLEQLLRRVYGPRAERIDPAQLVLFAPELADSEASGAEGEPEEEPGCAGRRRGHGRKSLPKDLPRRRIEHTVPAKERVCAACGADKERIGEEVSEQLEYIPASVCVLEHVREKLACPQCRRGVTVADKPAQAIEKGLPGPGMLAHVATSKYCDHLPLHRLEGIFARHGLDLRRSTLCDWIQATARRLEPLVAAMQARVVQSKVVHTDDTPVRVMDGKGTHFGRLWVYVGDENHPYTVFDYTATRSREGPERFLREFRGTCLEPRYLQADAYSGYDRLYGRNGITEVGCWAHTRRYFHQAQSDDPVRAHVALARIKQLYAVERRARDLAPAERQALRQEEARPLLKNFEQWLHEQDLAAVHGQPIGQALQYARNHWGPLTAYLEDGDLKIDNNLAEQVIRPIAVGRKNWMFAGSDRGGHAGAALYSVIASAKRHHIDPFAYLRDLLERIPHPCAPAPTEFLPDNWRLS